MNQQNKTLRQYRRDQEESKNDRKGSDLEDHLLSEPPHQALQEQSLWRSVILQMLTDALSNSKKRDHIRFKRDAWHWLTSHSRDFRMVCDYAGYDPVWMQEQINNFLSNHQSPFIKPNQQTTAIKQFSIRHGLCQSATMPSLPAIKHAKSKQEGCSV